MDELDVKRWRTTFLRKIFAVSSTIQAFSWFVLATICIILFYVTPGSVDAFYNNMSDESSSFVDLLSYCLYLCLFDRENTFIAHVIQPLRFHIIAWIYLAFSGIWAGVSVAECLALFKGKNRQYSKHFQIASGVIILLVSALDAVLFSIALYDYQGINVFDLSAWEEEGDSCGYRDNLDAFLRYVMGPKIVFGVLATLAARGFVLWVFNVVVGFFSVVHPIQVFQMPPLLQYEEPIPRPKLAPSEKVKGFKSGRSSVEPVYMDDESEFFGSLPREKRNWYNQQAPLPLTYYDSGREQPRFANSKHRQPRGNERF